MATPAFPLRRPPAGPDRPGRFTRLRRVVIVVLAIVGAVLGWYGRPLLATARTGSAYGARMACACHFVAGRPLGDCRRDFEPGMALVTLAADEQARHITARFALLVPQRASYREGWGCQLDRWTD